MRYPTCIFGDERGLLTVLFSTHPPTGRRIDRLMGMAARDAPSAPPDATEKPEPQFY